MTKILPLEDNKVDLGSPLKKFKNIYYASLTPDPGTGYLPLVGGTMQGGIDLGAHELKNIGSLSGGSNTRAANDILSCATNGVSGNIATFSATPKVVQDSGTALNTLATAAALATKLSLSGGIMTGGVDLGANELKNVSNISGASSTRSVDPSCQTPECLLQAIWPVFPMRPANKSPILR